MSGQACFKPVARYRFGFGPSVPQRVCRDVEMSGGFRKPPVITRERDFLAVTSQKLDRGEVQGVERPHRRRKRLERSLENRRSQLDQSDAAQQTSHRLGMRRREPP